MRLNARKLKEMLISGANALDNNKEAINNMNVFPVPDGDTGINMSLTMGAVRGMSEGHTYVGDCAAEAASLILRSARGNSGAILALFYRGIAKAWKGFETVGAEELVKGLREGCNQAYRAVMKPTEGTILTVMRRCAEEAEASFARDEYNDDTLLEFFKHITDVAKEALEQTPDMLPVLREVGVVDAGGCGFTTAFSGMLAALEKNPVILLSANEANTKKADFSEFDTDSITFPYCTECVCEKFSEFEGEERAEELHKFICSIGDSVVFIEDESIIKLHVHTDHPGLVMEKAGEYGMLMTVKVENMRNQHSELVASEAEASATKPKIAEPENDYGFVSVCMGKGIADTFCDLGADTVVQGGQTMNPSTQDIIDGVRRTPAKTVFVLPNNKNIYIVALQAAKLVKDRNVVVLNTKSVPQGISAMIAFNCEADVDENTATMEKAIGTVTSMSITQAIKSTTIEGEKIRNGQMLGLMNGAIECVANSTHECLQMLSEKMENASFITLFYGLDVSDEEARIAEGTVRAKNENAEITVISGGQPLYDFIISVE